MSLECTLIGKSVDCEYNVQRAKRHDINLYAPSDQPHFSRRNDELTTASRVSTFIPLLPNEPYRKFNGELRALLYPHRQSAARAL